MPYSDQGWSYFHPPLYYGIGWLLAQSGSSEVLLRGLALFGSAACLGMAALSAGLARRLLPDRPVAPLVAFTSVAFLPVLLYTAPMPGNEVTAALLGCAAVAWFVASGHDSKPRNAQDLGAGILAGLALLTKASAAVPLLAILLGLAITALREPSRRRSSLRRALLVGGVALLLAAPYYARNLAEFGTPLRLSRNDPLVAQVESRQPTGERGWSDYLSFPPSLFLDSSPGKAHLVGSVWGTLYLDWWSDLYGSSHVPRRELRAPYTAQGLVSALALAGVIPTLLALLGAGLSLRVALRKASEIDTVLLLLAGGNLLALALFTQRVPVVSAVKGSYILTASLAYGVFVARALDLLIRRAGRAASWAAGLGLAAAAILAVAVHTHRLLLPARPPSPNVPAVRAWFGEHERARREFAALPAVFPPSHGGQAGRHEVLGGFALRAGEWSNARAYYGASLQAAGEIGPYSANRLAVANALAGDPAAALELLDRALEHDAVAELLVNRAAVGAQLGRFEQAERDLRVALELDASLAPAWGNLAFVLERSGALAESQAARAQAAEHEARAPRGFPHGVGNGYIWGAGRGQRWQLVAGTPGLQLYRHPRDRSAP